MILSRRIIVSHFIFFAKVARIYLNLLLSHGQIEKGMKDLSLPLLIQDLISNRYKNNLADLMGYQSQYLGLLRLSDPSDHQVVVNPCMLHGHTAMMPDLLP